MRVNVHKVPLFDALCAYEWEVHKHVLKKFAVLWFFSASPLLLSCIFFVSRSPSTGRLQPFVQSLYSEFTGKSIYIYATSFIVPLLYVFWEEYISLLKYAFSRKTAPDDLRPPPSFGLILCIALIAFGMSAALYGFLENQGVSTYFATLTFAIYLYAMFCWYFTLLMRADNLDAGVYTRSLRAEEASMQDQLDRRVQESDGEND